MNPRIPERAPLKTRSRAEAGTKERQFRPLPREFRRGDFQFRQVAREGDAAIYEQTFLDCPNPSVSYEVIRLRRHDGFWINNRFVEPAEVYPNSEAWGVDGWTFTDKDRAFAKFREMIAQAPLKQKRRSARRANRQRRDGR